MNSRMALAASVLIGLSLSGCATQAQVEAQTNQLRVIQTALEQIQANQQQAIVLQKAQVALQEQSYVLQNTQFSAQLESDYRRAHPSTMGQKHE
jgi:murein lipoprotein